jgi:tripeptide aminopeptidase
MARNSSVKHLCRCVILFVMTARTTATRGASPLASAADLAANPRVAQALAWLTEHVHWVNEQQARLTAIPAPAFHEAERAAAVKKLLSSSGLSVRMDRAGNVVGELRGARDAEIIILSAHLDTVFPVGTDVRVRREGERLLAPGISDNGAGLAGLVAVAHAVQTAHIKPLRTILFVANVGEEGEGNLRGMRAIVEEYRSRLKGVIAVDGSATDYVTTMALASRRLEVAVKGPGGHSWSDFGIPNPISALTRGLDRFLKYPVPDSPRTVFNIGQIEGGTSVNSIPHEARVKIDLRSEQEPEIARMEAALREAIEAGAQEENAAARDLSKGKLQWSMRVLGERPGGELSPDSPLLAALRGADSFLGNTSRLERSSTDANVPLSLGIEAIALGAGGRAGGAHSLREWYDPTGRDVGLKRILLTLLGVAGLSGGSK